MEYGIRVTDTSELPSDPRTICPVEWREILPPGQIQAIYFGTEFCETLLPDFESAEELCRFSHDSGLDAVMLTPIVTGKGLGQLDHLLDQLTAVGWIPEVVFNDWGVLNLLQQRYPALPRRSGRLINRGLRDPRVFESRPTVESSLTDRGQRIRSMLAKSGVSALETDPDLEGSFLGNGSDGMERVLYFPYVFVASSRNCLIKADGAKTLDDCFTKGLGSNCNRNCQGRWHQVHRDDTSGPLWRAGNTLFYEIPRSFAEKHLLQADRVVLFERPTP